MRVLLLVAVVAASATARVGVLAQSRLEITPVPPPAATSAPRPSGTTRITPLPSGPARTEGPGSSPRVAPVRPGDLEASPGQPSIVTSTEAQPRSRVSVAPVDASGGRATPLPSGSLRIEPREGSRLGTSSVGASEIGPATAAPISRVAIAPTARSSLATALAPVSRARLVALPVSVATIEGMGGSAVTAARLRSELGATETDRGTLISLPGDVLFDFDAWSIRRDARPTLAKLAELITLSSEVPILIEGHTDAKGSDAYNLELSERRAASVAAYLVERHGIDASRIMEEGMGESAPVAPNTKPGGGDDPQGRQRNRRVEVVLLRQ